MGRKGWGTNGVVRDEGESWKFVNPPFAAAVIRESQRDLEGRKGWGTHILCAKKLRYMSKIASIFATTDNTHLSCTQPIWNLPVACL